MKTASSLKKFRKYTVPDIAATSQKVSPDTVQSILRELIDLMTEIYHLNDDLAAKGIPASTVDELVNHAKQDATQDYNELRDRALNQARDKLGGRAVSEDVLEQHIQSLVGYTDELAGVRRLSRTFELDMRAINMLSQIVRLNPGDNGLKVLNNITDYARAFGIPLGGVSLVSSQADSTPKSVLPDIQLPEPGEGIVVKYRALAIEVGLGILVTVTALTLLN